MGQNFLTLKDPIVSLVRLIIAAVERIFPLVLIAPLQVCSSSLHNINTVLIAPLQSPWSSVTQGPFALHVSNNWAVDGAHPVVWLLLLSPPLRGCSLVLANGIRYYLRGDWWSAEVRSAEEILARLAVSLTWLRASEV